ncbi:MAG: radical SAM/SPASM domain-containing protein [Flavobacteriales bacterium]
MIGSITDGMNLLSKLTFRRAWNIIKVISSFYYSRLTKKPVQWGIPFSITLEPTTSCNLRCPECPSGLRSFTRDTGNADTDFQKRLIDEFSKKSIYLLFYFQGEPFIHPNFLDMVSYASKKGMYTASSTNAHFLNDKVAKRTVRSGLDRLIISIDGTTQETYESYRRTGKLEKVIEGTKNIIKWKNELNVKKPHVIFQFLVVAPNEHQIPEVKKLGDKLGVNEVRYKTAQIYDYKNGNSLIPNNEKYSRYRKKEDGTYEIKNKLLDHCWKLWHSCVITWDGIVVPCCFDKDAKHRMGDLKERDFEDIWFNGNYGRFRTSILNGRKNIDICRNCTEGCKVWE